MANASPWSTAVTNDDNILVHAHFTKSMLDQLDLDQLADVLNDLQSQISRLTLYALKRAEMTNE